MNPVHHQRKPSTADEMLGQLLGAVANLNDNMGQIHNGYKTMRGVLTFGAEPRALNGATAQRLSASAGRLAGFSLRETSGTNPATIVLHDGPDLNGDTIIAVTLAANESARDWFMPGGISFVNGLTVEIAAGQIDGHLYLGTTVQ